MARPAVSSRAWAKVPAIQAKWPPPAKMYKELACWLQTEEEAVEKTRQGRDEATLEVVMEAARLLTHGQLEGLGVCAGQVHPKVAGLSYPPAAVVVQPPMVVA